MSENATTGTPSACHCSTVSIIDFQMTVASLSVAEHALREEPYDRLPYLAVTMQIAQSQMETLRQEAMRLRSALLEIRDSKFNAYENTGSGQYGIGVCDGHRYCANIARDALGDEMVAKWNRRDWQGMTRQATTIGFLQGVLQGLRIGIDDERAAIIDAALSDERHFAT